MSKKEEGQVELRGKSKEIWEKIKNHEIEMFGLPGQIISKFCTPVPVDENNLYIKISVSCVVASLDPVIAKYKLNMKQEDNGYLVISEKNAVR